MASCKTVERLYDVLPLRPVRDWLIRVHMDRCPRCQARLLSRDEAKSLLVGPAEAGSPEALWRRIAGAAGRAAAVPGTRPAGAPLIWRWASVTAVAAAVALTGFWLLREIDRPGAAPADRFQIDYVKVGGVPAQTFVYQPQGTDTVFVWASRTP